MSSIFEITQGDFNYHNIGRNFKLLRRRLEMTQKKFIEKFFVMENGKKYLTVSKLSMIENGDTTNIDYISDIFARNSGVERRLLYLSSENFALQLEEIIEKYFPDFKDVEISMEMPLKRNSYVEDIVKVLSDYITESILSGRLNPGDKIPSERDMVKLFDVSRSALREAIKVLATIGLLDVCPGQGTFISTKNSSFFDAHLSWGLLVGEKTSRDILEIRMILECESAYYAAKRGSDEDFAELKEILKGMEKVAKDKEKLDIEGFLNLDVSFHLAIAKVMQNQIVYHLFSTIRKLMRHYSQSGMTKQEDLIEIYHEHAEIVAAIVERDADKAKEAMHAHIVNSNARYG